MPDLSLTLHLDILPDAQRRLWEELQEVPPAFTLYGGTAVALHLGHRHSVDFDFFAAQPFHPAELYDSIAFLRDAEIIQQQSNTLTCLVGRHGPVKVSFFGLPQLRRVAAPHRIPENRLAIASLLDLAGTKAAVVQQRAEAKDYVDLDALLGAGISLSRALAAAQAIYGARFNPQLTLKALSYFRDGDLQTLPDEMKNRLVKAVLATDPGQLPLLTSIDGKESA